MNELRSWLTLNEKSVIVMQPPSLKLSNQNSKLSLTHLEKREKGKKVLQKSIQMENFLANYGIERRWQLSACVNRSNMDSRT